MPLELRSRFGELRPSALAVDGVALDLEDVQPCRREEHGPRVTRRSNTSLAATLTDHFMAAAPQSAWSVIELEIEERGFCSALKDDVEAVNGSTVVGCTLSHQ
jgi:hypothetical protein